MQKTPGKGVLASGFYWSRRTVILVHAKKKSYPAPFLKPRRAEEKLNLFEEILKLCSQDGFVNKA
jgi:hypothetical protein